MVAAAAERHDGMMALTFDSGSIIHDRRKGNDNTLMVRRCWRWLRGEALKKRVGARAWEGVIRVKHHGKRFRSQIVVRHVLMQNVDSAVAMASNENKLISSTISVWRMRPAIQNNLQRL